jgi:hypothetical protein
MTLKAREALSAEQPRFGGVCFYVPKPEPVAANIAKLPTLLRREE